MSIVELLHRLKDSNIELGLTGDDIEVNFDGQELPAGIQEEIRDNKTAIVAFLKEMSAGHTLSAFVRERPAQIPLSYAQERLWFIDELSGSIQYHMTISFRLKGPLDREGLAYSFQAVIRRHESLRTVIREHHGEAYQQVLPAGGWSMDYREDPEVDEVSLRLHIEAVFARPFDLERDHMLRAELIRVGEED
ncbi:MAG TPA: condensation domain-containing protein, partial [Puia sp.]|nr:condensation domain-containing protein [Puia sp.]